MRLAAIAPIQGSAGILSYGLLGAKVAREGTEFIARLDGRSDQFVSAPFQPNEDIVFRVHGRLLASGVHHLTVTTASRSTLFSKATARVKFAALAGSALSRRVARLLSNKRVPVLFAGPCDSSLYPYNTEEAQPRLDHPDPDAHIDRRRSYGEINATEATALRSFVKDGHMTLESLIDDSLIEAVNREIDHAIETGHDGYLYGTGKRIEHMHESYPTCASSGLIATTFGSQILSSTIVPVPVGLAGVRRESGAGLARRGIPARPVRLSPEEGHSACLARESPACRLGPQKQGLSAPIRRCSCLRRWRCRLL